MSFVPAKHSRRVWVCLRDAAAAALQGNASSVGSKHSVRFSSFIQSVLWFGVVCHDRGALITSIHVAFTQSNLLNQNLERLWALLLVVVNSNLLTQILHFVLQFHLEQNFSK